MNELIDLTEQYYKLVEELKQLQKKEQGKKNEIRIVLQEIKQIKNKSFLNRHHE